MRNQFGPIVIVGSDGYLQMLFSEPSGTNSCDTVVTFVFQFEEYDYSLKNLEKAANSCFTDVRVTYPPEEFTLLTNLVFTVIVHGPIRDDQGLLHAIKNKLQKVIATARKL